VPWAKAGVGAVATQAWCNPAFGPDGLALLAAGCAPQEVVSRLSAADPGAEHRQFGVVDVHGRSASFTGPACMDWAGGVTGENFAVQGNILVSGATVAAMAAAFTDTPGDLAERLTMALVAGQAAGGDSRGQQAAALYIAKEGAGYLGNNDRFVDIRVDEHPDPITELRRILALYRMLFYKTKPANVVPLAGEVADFVTGVLRRGGYLAGEPGPGRAGEGWDGGGWDEASHAALSAFFSTENFEERMCEPGFIDAEVVDYLRSRADG
jgi:uncharacterized Ntn-hydrolase superfamily protein